IIVVNDTKTFNKGIAYNPYSGKHLLNVTAGKMSAYPDKPDHFLDWTMQREHFMDKEIKLISNSYLPRKLYGEYLCHVWEDAKKIAQSKQIKLSVIDSFVVDLDISENAVSMWLDNNWKLTIQYCVIATGNHIPRNPKIVDSGFFQGSNYFQNPWKIESVQMVNGNLPVLIIGNGLTMV